MLAVDLGVLIVCLVALWLITDKMVSALSSLAQEFSIPQSVAGATLAGIGSSMPEFGTSAFAVVLAAVDSEKGYADVGFGTVVGSALFNLCMIIGISALVRPLDVARRVVTRDLTFYLVACCQTVFFIWDSRITTWEATVWVVTYAIYFTVLMRDIRRHPDAVEQVEQVESIPTRKAICWFVFSILVIGIACHFLVRHTTNIANLIGLPTALISIVVLAFGTSIPDLLASVQATRQGNTSLAVSNAIGSNVFDILICLGLPVLIYNVVRGAVFHLGVIPDSLASSLPAEFSRGLLLLSVVFLVVTVIACCVVLSRRWRVSRGGGLTLIGIYLAFLVCLLILWIARKEAWLGDLLARFPAS